MKFQLDFQLTNINEQQIYAFSQIELLGGDL